jgi:hypothetical protein
VVILCRTSSTGKARMYLEDGHHRVTRALIDGHHTIEARVLTVERHAP